MCVAQRDVWSSLAAHLAAVAESRVRIPASCQYCTSTWSKNPRAKKTIVRKKSLLSLFTLQIEQPRPCWPLSETVNLSSGQSLLFWPPVSTPALWPPPEDPFFPLFFTCSPWRGQKVHFSVFFLLLNNDTLKRSASVVPYTVQLLLEIPWLTYFRRFAIL